ncbi:MAG: tetratricopeptide repeat protein [Thermoleophilia bacterium]|nr:tetratricopeptide repeat protein [Thermoleophilia bacterium]
MDRKRINRWAKWFAIILAATFALGTVFLGVGSSTGNIFSGCDKSSPDSINSSSSFEDREAYYKSQIDQNPLDTDSMMALANLYADASVNRFDDAIIYYNKALVITPNNAATIVLIGKANMNKGDFEAAVKALTSATQVAPADAYNFFLLGQAAKAAGQNQTAILAWSKYLELNPNDPNAQLIKDEIAKLATLPAVTPQETTTVPGSPGTTAPVSPTPVSPLPTGTP